MRFLMINLFLICLFLFGIGYLAFGHDETKTISESYAYYAGDAPWDAALETFYKLIKTDPEAARHELQSVAKECSMCTRSPNFTKSGAYEPNPRLCG